MFFLAERELDRAVDQIRLAQHGAFIRDRRVVDAQAAALDLPARGPVAATTTAADDGGAVPPTLSLSFTIRAETVDILYEVQSSQDLVTWNLAATYSANGTKRIELASVPILAAGNRFFLRLRVVAVP